MAIIRARSRAAIGRRNVDASERVIDYEIRELTSLLYAAMNRFQTVRRTLASSLDLTPAEFAVVISLHRLSSGNGARIRELANDIHVAAANVTATVKALEMKGWVVKRADPRDTRALSVELSAASRARLNKFFETIHPVNEIWFRNIPKSDQLTVKKFLARLIDQYPPALQEARMLKRRLSKQQKPSPQSSDLGLRLRAR